MVRKVLHLSCVMCSGACLFFLPGLNMSSTIQGVRVIFKDASFCLS